MLQDKFKKYESTKGTILKKMGCPMIIASTGRKLDSL
jgi:hypothetical protein